MTTTADNWESEWDAAVQAIGTELAGDSPPVFGALVEQTAVDRFLEMLEMDCPLYFDEAVAATHGYSGVVAPAGGLFTWIMDLMWRPGRPPIWTSAARDAQPARARPREATTSSRTQVPMPATTAFFATDIEIEYLAPMLVGRRYAMHGRRLVSVVPKETRVGRGAFLQHESSVVDDAGNVVALVRTGMYMYNPHAREDGDGDG